MRFRWLAAAAVVAGIGIADLPILAKPPNTPTPHMDAVRSPAHRPPPRTFLPAAVDTFVLGDYDWGLAMPHPHGWTSVDRSLRADTMFHVEDFADMEGSWYAPIGGAKSLWCGTRVNPEFSGCALGCLPGYLDYWEQRFESVEFPRTGDLVVSFRARWDSEPDYDATRMEYQDADGYWQEVLRLDGRGDLPISVTIPGSNLPPEARLRFHFSSDGFYSDEDCRYPSDGAIIIDDLTIRDDTGVLDYQSFESEPAGARTTSDGDWSSAIQPPFGDYASLMPGAALVQEDPCTRAVSAVWTFIKNSTAYYSCGGNPGQKAIPYGNLDGLYIWNEIRSPLLEWNQDAGGATIPATASGAVLSFDVYRDLPLEGVVFYVWHVRAFDTDGCPAEWRDRNTVYYGSQKDWYRATFEFGDLIPPGTDMIQVAIGVRDMCRPWCGLYGTSCHTHAPVFGDVKISRVDFAGPRWSVRDLDLFQDSFAGDGTLTGTVRADMANDIMPAHPTTVLPGDSSVVSVNDPNFGLADDLALGGKKVYCYVAVQPQQAPKTGESLSGGPRWPYAGSETIDGIQWTCLRLDECVVEGLVVADKYCIDLNDTLFTPGDTIHFFCAAENTSGQRTYAYGASISQQGSDIGSAAADPAEFTCLPAGGWRRGGEILYVDGMDGRGAQPFWDSAFASLAMSALVDRYDVRAPSSTVDNQLSGRVADVAAQLSACYRVILWDCGDLYSLGTGSGYPGKLDDFALFSVFLESLALPGGLYVCGDDVPLATWIASSFRAAYIPFGALIGDHRPSFGVSPLVLGKAGGCFDGDSFYLAGGCPLLNDFDVMEPTGTSVMEVSYGPPEITNAAVVSNRLDNTNSVDVGVMLSGFSFIYIVDDETDGVLDRSDHLHDVLAWLMLSSPSPTGAVSRMKDSLAQNYPNPFNPATTISFSLAARERVSLVIYSVAGERVRELVGETLPAGTHTRSWDGTNNAGEAVGSGVYFYRIVTPGFTSARKMVLLK